jgi:hypothetical protein
MNNIIGKRIRPIINLKPVQLDRLLHEGSIKLMGRNRIKKGKICRESFFVRKEDLIRN